MRVFVAGATGFIGRAACRALAAAGHEVTGLARDETKARDLATLGVRVIVGTLDDPGTFLAQADRPEAIVHLAATWFDGPETIEQAGRIGDRILGWTRSLARLGIESKSRSFVFAGNNRLPVRRPDSADAGPHRPVGYDRILAPSQTYLETAAGIPLTMLVPGWVYGAGSWFPEAVRQIRAGQTHHLIGDGEVHLGYVEVGDVGEAFRLAAEKGAAGTSFNVVDEEPLTVRQFVEETARALGVPPPRGFTHDQARHDRGQVFLEALTSPASLDIGPTRRELGWRPRFTSAREGLPVVLRTLGA
jgi:nucleoside-diphosphate-sugar epimerase